MLFATFEEHINLVQGSISLKRQPLLSSYGRLNIALDPRASPQLPEKHIIIAVSEATPESTILKRRQPSPPVAKSIFKN